MLLKKISTRKIQFLGCLELKLCSGDSGIPHYCWSALDRLLSGKGTTTVVTRTELPLQCQTLSLFTCVMCLHSFSHFLSVICIFFQLIQLFFSFFTVDTEMKLLSLFGIIKDNTRGSCVVLCGTHRGKKNYAGHFSK